MDDLILPRNIPVAAESLEDLMRIGDPEILREKYEALALVSKDKSDDPCSVWVKPKFSDYRGVWDTAARYGLVEPKSEWGPHIDIDHVYPRSWANLPDSKLEYVRLFPVWGEVNQLAGATREKEVLKLGMINSYNSRKHGIVYANEMQVLKILGPHVVEVDPATQKSVPDEKTGRAKPFLLFGAKRKR